MGSCCSSDQGGGFPDDSIHVALRKHGGQKKSRNPQSYAQEYVPRAAHPLMVKEAGTTEKDDSGNEAPKEEAAAPAETKA
mmetsp:Transcript_4758/g.7235  ORF Transcript_4758/g.7235 Transcript_4758/m.7235 type:complete len:80 (+) Transcript_4758:142-381(+)|eukprot:CAMPEP_0196806042 /NCGR_PEP_ID=MMETSP1362-20130617/5909_1 /TAXON_ID=163516 /ORGANISM="Leptocylindrus danicus, Strain CCMP1856" /LENGTH=79 /DNA_ID=CAMNT_0042179327 /DNA_START=142 /DNA_END=381 /DNA_ORIENTATION=-